MSHSVQDLEAFAHDYAKAWCSGDPAAVAACFEPTASIVINAGEPMVGTKALTGMAAAFHAEFPGMAVLCDDIRVSGNHAVFVWTLVGRHAETKNEVRARGWEKWDISDNLKIAQSKGWFDRIDYQSQIDEGYQG